MYCSIYKNSLFLHPRKNTNQDITTLIHNSPLHLYFFCKIVFHAIICCNIVGILTTQSSLWFSYCKNGYQWSAKHSTRCHFGTAAMQGNNTASPLAITSHSLEQVKQHKDKLLREGQTWSGNRRNRDKEEG